MLPPSSHGDNVIATARTLSKIAHLKSAGTATLELDVTSPIEVLREVAREAVDLFGRVDVLVNNAGMSVFGTVEEAT